MEANVQVIEESVYRIIDWGGYRDLRVRGDDTGLLGRMEFAAPDALVLAYMVAMMRFVVFKPEPADVVLIGLGGGLQAKFIHGRMPNTRLTAVEIDPVMVRIARMHFGVPADDERLSVVVDDGSDYIAAHPGSCDVILSDGYDQSNMIDASLTEEAFYHACHRALRPSGMMAINLFRKDRAWRVAHAAMLSQMFSAVLSMSISENQAVLLVFKDEPHLDWAALGERAESLEKKFGLGLPEFVRQFATFSQKESNEAPAPDRSAPLAVVV